MYFIQKNLTRLKNNQCTFFLDPKELFQVKLKLGKSNYSIYYPYKDSEKNIIYTGNIPKVILYEIVIKTEVRHQDILGSLYSLNIAPELFGDILLIDGKYYLYALDMIRNYLENNFTRIKNSSIELVERDLSLLENYERKYEKLKFIVSSNRIDTVISSICHTGRNVIPDMIKKKEIILNYDFLKDNSYKLKDNDVFSIKRIGKFKYNGVIKNTKSNHLIIEVLKYI